MQVERHGASQNQFQLSIRVFMYEIERVRPNQHTHRKVHGIT